MDINRFADMGIGIPAGLKKFYGDGSDGVLDTTGNVVLAVPTEDVSTIIKQYTSITINAGHTLSVDKRCRGLVLYCTGDVVINGVIDMNSRSACIDNSVGQKAVVVANEVIGMFLDATSDGIIRIPAGGNGGDGGGGSYRDGKGGKGTVGLWFGGGRAGGGAGGAGYTSGYPAGNGGDSNLTVQVGASGGLGVEGSGATPLPESNGSYGSGGGGTGASSAKGGNGGSSLNGQGGGGGAGGYGINGANGEPALGFGGGLIIIIAKGNVIIGSTGVIKANGIRGGNGGNNSGIASGNGGNGGGGNGGGVVTIAYKGTFSNAGSISVAGGIGGSGGGKGTLGNLTNGLPGIAGGIGSITIRQIK